MVKSSLSIPTYQSTGKCVTITLAISKLTFVCSVLNTPDNFADDVNKLIFDYIWKYNNPKVKKTTLIQSKEEGGLNVVDYLIRH